MGGCNKTGVLDSIELFNTEKNTVTLVETKLKLPRCDFCCCLVNANIHLTAGVDENVSQTENVEILDVTDPYIPVISEGVNLPKTNNFDTYATACTF